MASPQILYALVARQVNVLAEHQTPAVPFDLPTATRLVLQRIPPEDKRHTFEFDREFLFVCIVEDGITFLCLCHQNSEMRRVYGFLEDVKSLFMTKFRQEAYTAHTFALNSSFAPVLEDRLNYYNYDPEALMTDALGRVQKKAQENMGQMQNNIDMVLERGEKIDILVEKTEALDQNAFKFEKSAKAVKHSMLCKRIKTYICIGVTLLILLYVILAFLCGGLDLHKCTNSGDDDK
jgi:vesicle-associated membrane protein 7